MYINASLILKFCVTSGPPHLFITSSIPQPFLFMYSELGKTAQNQMKCVRARLICWLGFSCSQTGLLHQSPVETQVNDKTYHMSNALAVKGE